MSVKVHPLFQQFPLTGEQEISVGSVPIPYHTYDGHGMFIGGTADLNSTTHLLANEQVIPMQTTDGKALMGVWVVDFTEASLGPHNELQFTVLVAHQPTEPIEAHPLAMLKALFANQDARMFCYGLWNDTETAVCYNRELLGLNVQLNQGQIQRYGGQKTFQFHDKAGNLLCAGHIQEKKRTPAKVGWALTRLMGLRQTMKSFSEPYFAAKVVNPIGDVVPHNADAQSYLAPDTPIVQMFDPATDQISFNETYAKQFKFRPHFIEHFAPFRFVYLRPDLINSR